MLDARRVYTRRCNQHSRTIRILPMLRSQAVHGRTHPRVYFSDADCLAKRSAFLFEGPGHMSKLIAQYVSV